MTTPTTPNTAGRLQAFWSTAIWYLGGAAAIQAVNFVAQPVFALFMSPEEWGVAATYVFWMTAFGLAIGFQAQTALNNVRTTYGEETLAVYIRSVLPWYALPTGLLLAALAVAPGWWGDRLGLPAGYLALAVVNGVLFAISAMGMSHAVTLGLRRRFVGLSLSITVAPLVIGLVLVLAMADDALARIIGYFVGTALVVAFQALRVSRTPITPQRALVGFGLAIALPLLAHELLYLVMSQANRVFLSALVDRRAAGVFAFAFSLGNVAVVAATAVNSSWTPWYFEHTRAAEDQRVRRTGADLLLGFAVAIGAASLISPEGLRLISRAEYGDGALVVPALLVAGHLVLVFNMAANYAVYQRRTRLVLAVSAGAAVLSVALNLTLIPRWDILGAAIANVASALWLAVGMMVVSCQVLGSRNLPQAAAALSVLISGGCLAVAWWAFDHPVVRFTLAGALLLLLAGALARRLRRRSAPTPA